MSYLKSTGSLNIVGLEQQISSTLTARLNQNQLYNLSEVDQIASYPFRLFPTDFELTEDETTKMRALCTLSQCQLRPATSITSHRRFIGPVIVFIKKLSWPFIKLHLKETLAGIQGFQSWNVKTIAGLIVSSRVR